MRPLLKILLILYKFCTLCLKQNSCRNSRETVMLTECDTSLLFTVVPLQVNTSALAEVRSVIARLVVAVPLHVALWTCSSDRQRSVICSPTLPMSWLVRAPSIHWQCNHTRVVTYYDNHANNRLFLPLLNPVSNVAKVDTVSLLVMHT